MAFERHRTMVFLTHAGILGRTTRCIPTIIIESPFGNQPLNLFCPICGHDIANPDRLDLCEHCLAAFLDGDLIAFNELGKSIFEDQTRPELFHGDNGNPNQMIATDSNFILGNLAGGMACGPVWTQFNLVFEAYPERLEREDNEG